MKKTALALAVAAALGTVAAQAETTLYGSARVSVDYVDNEDLQKTGDSWDVFNNSSRLGVKGSEDLGGGLSAIYQYEFGVDISEGTSGFRQNRPKWVGLQSKQWGSVIAGTMWTPYYNAIGVVDIFNSDRYTLSPLNTNLFVPQRTDNTVAYMTPDYNGFQFQGAVMMNGITQTNDGNGNLPGGRGVPNTTNNVDSWNVTGIYKNGPLFIGATYVAVNGGSSGGSCAVQNPPNGVSPPGGCFVNYTPGDLSGAGASLGYTIAEQFTIAYAFQYGDLGGLMLPASQFPNQAAYGFGPNGYISTINSVQASDPMSNTLVLAWKIGSTTLKVGGNYVVFKDLRTKGGGTTSSDSDDLEITNYAAGIQHDLSKRTRLWVEYIDKDANVRELNNQSAVSVGMRHDF